jgi:hypothetical protein
VAAAAARFAGSNGAGGGGAGSELPDEFWGAADYCGYLRAEYDAGGRCAVFPSLWLPNSQRSFVGCNNCRSGGVSSVRVGTTCRHVVP